MASKSHVSRTPGAWNTTCVQEYNVCVRVSIRIYNACAHEDAHMHIPGPEYNVCVHRLYPGPGIQRACRCLHTHIQRMCICIGTRLVACTPAAWYSSSACLRIMYIYTMCICGRWRDIHLSMSRFIDSVSTRTYAMHMHMHRYMSHARLGPGIRREAMQTGWACRQCGGQST